MTNAESLSADDLRARLYHSLREKGLVDALKSQLRNKLVSELRQIGVEQTFDAEPQRDVDGSLLHKASNSLVVDHMKHNHYDYSLSVFLPECGTPESQLFTSRDLLHLLNISPQSRLYQKLETYSDSSQGKGFLWQLLCQVAAVCGNSCRDSGIQTDPTRLPGISSLDEQLNKVDHFYSSMEDGQKHSHVAVEERILSYQRQLDERSRTELKLEMARFKENELARMRMEEREKSRQDIEKLRREMESSYRVKHDALSERERHANERLQKEQLIAEKETYNQRQSLLEEIESVRQREINMKRTEEVNLREKNLWEDKMKTREQLVKKREDDVRKAQIEYDQKLRNETQKFKLEEQARLLERTKDLDYREIRVRENERRLDDELRGVDQTKEELREKRKQCHELEGELSLVKHELITARSESELLSGKVRQMVDYQIVKEENVVMHKEMEISKMRIAELSRDMHMERQKYEELLREMTERASKPTPEVYLMQKEVDKLRNELKQERAIFDHQKQNMDKRYQDEVARSHELLRKFEEQTLQLEDMNREQRDLRHQLGQTKTALTNEVYGKPKTSALNRSNSPCELDAGGVDPTLLRTANEPELLFSASHGLINNILQKSHRERSGSHSEDYSYSMDIVEDTKSRLRNLEKEAENLAQHYQNFQYRMTSAQAPIIDETSQTSRPTNRVAFREHVGLAEPVTPPRSNRLMDRPVTPLSSTPARTSKEQEARSREMELLSPPHSNKLYGDSSLINNSMSTVQSSPAVGDELDGRSVSHRPLSLDDLEHRPGSPPVFVLKPSAASAGQKAAPTASREILTSHQPSNSIVNKPVLPSLDSAWQKQTDADAERRRQQEEEDRAYEEEQRRKAEERERKQQAAWEAEQRELARLQGAKSNPDTAQDVSSVNRDVDKTDPEPSAKQSGVDPMVQKYMDIVQRNKQKEEESAKQSVDKWSTGRQEKTPSVSEEISQVEDDKSVAAEVSDGDFW